ncbi:MAG: ABC transporter permease subunit [Paracoccaceae bacterium]|nr:ABC transporter permease subunit [Paracoccaceae bacterium]
MRLGRGGRAGIGLRTMLWLGLFAASLGLAAMATKLPDWVLQPPETMQLGFAGWVSAAMSWLLEQASFGFFTVKQATRGIAAVIDLPYEAARVALVDGITEGRGRRATTIIPPVSWIAVTAAMVALGIHARNIWLGVGVGALFLYLAVFGQWESAMVTLASIVIAVPIGVAGGLALGVGAYLWPRFDRGLSPVLDLMQTVPTFAYLVPILFLFGFGPVSALVATVIYAMPPMVRITTLALRSIPPEIQEFSTMVGCTGAQRMRRVLLPTALPDLMVGVNQVIMLSLNMVIIASMIGAGGLGFDVLNALRRLDIGGGVEAGLAITAMAVALDRLSQALAERSGQTELRHGSWVRRHPKTVLVLALVLVTGGLGLIWPWVQTYPKAATISTKLFWSDLVKYMNINYFDQLEAVKTALLVNLLLPVKRFLLALPWIWLIGLITLAGWQLGRAKLAALCLVLGLFLAATGLWEQAMTTVYLCGVSVLIAALIGVPLGVWSASSALAGRVIGGFIDTLQTLPSFVYLIPVVMLFRVGDFSAMIAVVLYALAPAVRYTAHGLRSVSPELIEAGIVCGGTRWQVLTRVRLPMALPDIMLGVNQTIMLALSMLVITALVGTRDLGQQVYAALATADVGAGVVAGVSVAAIAIIADRLIAAGAARARARLGQGEGH